MEYSEECDASRSGNPRRGTYAFRRLAQGEAAPLIGQVTCSNLLRLLPMLGDDWGVVFFPTCDFFTCILGGFQMRSAHPFICSGRTLVP